MTPAKKAFILLKLTALGVGIYLIMIALAMVFPFDYYKIGEAAFEEGKYVKALKNYQNVSQKDANYQNAQRKIQIVKPMADSIKALK